MGLTLDKSLQGSHSSRRKSAHAPPARFTVSLQPNLLIPDRAIIPYRTTHAPLQFHRIIPFPSPLPLPPPPPLSPSIKNIQSTATDKNRKPPAELSSLRSSHEQSLSKLSNSDEVARISTPRWICVTKQA